MQDDTKKPDQAKKPDQPNTGDHEGKIDDIAPRPISERDAQAVKGGIGFAKIEFP